MRDSAGEHGVATQVLPAVREQSIAACLQVTPGADAEAKVEVIIAVRTVSPSAATCSTCTVLRDCLRCDRADALCASSGGRVRIGDLVTGTPLFGVVRMVGVVRRSVRA